MSANTKHKKSLMEGFHKLTQPQRLERLKEFYNLEDSDLNILSGDERLDPEIAEHLIENVIGYFPLPLGVATNFCIDGKDLMIPMAVEETSIIAAASATAKWVRSEGLIRTYSKGNLIIGQIQLPLIRDLKYTMNSLHHYREELIKIANECVPSLVARGGGVRDLQFRQVPRPSIEGSSEGSMLVIHVLCDPCDAMGANLINQICEHLKPYIEKITNEKVGLCILSNLVDGKLVVAEVTIRNIDSALGKGIVEASLFAEADPYRATTHNKGVMNGIDPILIATGNDWRAVEAGVHAYASMSGSYQPITKWRMKGFDLVGHFEAPLALGVVGGVTQVHPTTRVILKMLQVTKAEELARICAAVGLVQNLGALKALSTVGIVKGHMNLHAANLAIAAGAEVHEISQVRERLSKILELKKKINLTDAKEILEDLRGFRSTE